MGIQTLRHHYIATLWESKARKQDSPLKNDCAFVCIAHMVGIHSTEQLLQRINWAAPTDPEGITPDQIREVLAALKCSFHWEDFNSTQTCTRFGLGVHPPRSNSFNETPPSCFAVLYRRKDGSGHCVIQDREHSYDYMDYQTNAEGERAWRDVREGFLESRFWIKRYDIRREREQEG